MNYFAHGYPFIDRPNFLAGTAVPDWLSVSDRAVRLRTKQVSGWIDDPSPLLSAVARGLAQHFRDDARFHETRAFAETSLALTLAIRGVLDQDDGFRPSFLGHLLTELLLDDALIAQRPERLDAYYQALATVDFPAIQAAVNRMSARPAERLGVFARQFLQARILSDYADDAKLLMRLNQIMRRVELPPLPDRLREMLPAARRLVTQRSQELLDGIPVLCIAHNRGEEPCVTG